MGKPPTSRRSLVHPTSAGAYHEDADGGWLILDYVGNPTLWLDVGMLDSIRANGAEVTLTLGDLVVVLLISGGPAKAAWLVERLAPYTRTSNVRSPEALAHAIRQLGLLANGAELHQSMLRLGEHPVLAKGNRIHIGRFSISIREVVDLAKRARTVDLPDGSKIHAILALLVIVAARRTGELEQLRSIVDDRRR